MSATASYGAQQLLHFSGEQLNGTAGPIATTSEDGVQVAAYFGDVTDTGGPLSLQDATAISAAAGTVPNTAGQTIPGFAAFPNLDPASSATFPFRASSTPPTPAPCSRRWEGMPRITIPYAPIGLPVVVNSGQQMVDGGRWTVGRGKTNASSNGSSVSPQAVEQAFSNSSSSVRDLASMQTSSGRGPRGGCQTTS